MEFVPNTKSNILKILANPEGDFIVFKKESIFDALNTKHIVISVFRKTQFAFWLQDDKTLIEDLFEEESEFNKVVVANGKKVVWHESDFKSGFISLDWWENYEKRD